MKKKNVITLVVAVVAVCILGVIASFLFSWPVNTDSTSGNIAKSSRFSRKTTTESIDNMEELLQADEDYKNGIMLAYSVMQTRALQFGTLVDMSNQAAGNIPEFEEVLKEMNELAPVIANVNESLVQAGSNINAVVNGESCPDVTQNTINASLAYSTLQKQNELANRFIDITDKYVKQADASDELRFVRDQWVDYQQATAALEGDTKAARKLEKKGMLLPAEKAAATLNNFDVIYQVNMLESAYLAKYLDVKNSLVSAFPDELIGQYNDGLHKSFEDAMAGIKQSQVLSQYLRPEEVFDVFRFSMADELAKASGNTLGGSMRPGLDQGETNGISSARPFLNSCGPDMIQAGYQPRVFYQNLPILPESMNMILIRQNVNEVIVQTSAGMVERLRLP